MSGSLVPFPDRRAAKWTTTKALSNISEAAFLAVAHEDALAEIADARIHNASLIVERTVARLAVIDHMISQVSHERPHLEMSLRIIQENLAIGIGVTLREYIQR
jgi:hypothetical protein